MTEFLDEHGSEAENMLFTEFNMEDALEVRFEEGIEEGKAKALTALVRKKLQRGMKAEQIAELLEEDVNTVARIGEAIRQNPDKDDASICAILRNEP